MISTSTLAWQGAGSPTQEKFKTTTYQGCCATCGVPINGEAVAISEIDNPTFSNHADFFPFPGKHVCPACAWLYGAGKAKPGNFIATPTSYEQAVISMDSVVDDKRPWLHILTDIATLPSDTPVTGVLTTDVKPRLWTRARVSTVGRFGLYVHAPDFDLSDHIDFSLPDLLGIVDAMRPALLAGYAKASLYHGLMRDYARAQKHMAQALEWEQALMPLRGNPAFLPALLVAGVSKQEKQDAKSR